jgi:hypothetical protein
MFIGVCSNHSAFWHNGGWAFVLEPLRHMFPSLQHRPFQLSPNPFHERHTAIQHKSGKPLRATTAGNRYEQKQREAATSNNSGRPLRATTARSRYKQQQREAATSNNSEKPLQGITKGLNIYGGRCDGRNAPRSDLFAVRVLEVLHGSPPIRFMYMKFVSQFCYK